MNDDDKYLSPDHNPMIPGHPGCHNRGHDEDPYLNGNYNPMIPRSEADYGRGCFNLSPDEIQARLSLRYPEANVVDLADGRQLVKMADGRTWRLNGKSISQLDPEDLLDLNKKI